MALESAVIKVLAFILSLSYNVYNYTILNFFFNWKQQNILLSVFRSSLTRYYYSIFRETYSHVKHIPFYHSIVVCINMSYK